ncbi:hypothetical protein KR059_012031, partial [Drosophila kikkawai]
LKIPRARRKLTKKKQRQRRRQKAAKERDKQEEEAENLRLADPEYQKCLIRQEKLEEFQRQAEEREQQEAERAWLHREAIAQQQFRIDEARRRQKQEEVERLQQEQARERLKREESLRKQREEHLQRTAKAAAEFEAMMQSMEEYLNDPSIQQPPQHLLRVMETHPDERPCEFYSRTNCCRYGHSCTFNHRRPMLSRILLIRHFFSHSLLQGQRTKRNEYSGADEELELTEQDMRHDYDEFFADAVEELQKFGTIVNFRTVRNTLEHLRGHVFVEYTDERSALRAFTNLQGRYYACKRLNVEFSNLKTWRGAVCGLSLTRICPKGNQCGYLHLFRNKDNLFNTELEYTTGPKSKRNSSQTPKAKTPSWDDPLEHGRNWRWSESPEPQQDNSKEYKTRRGLDDTSKHQTRSRSDRDSKRSSSKRDRSSSDSHRREHHRSNGYKHSRNHSQ